MGTLERLAARYRGAVEFVLVYTREAHPVDGWREPSNDEAGIAVRQPVSIDGRHVLSRQFCSRLKISMPVVVDEMDDRVSRAYSGTPERLYIVDAQGRIAYKGGRGPCEFEPDELEQALILMLLGNETPAD